MILKCDHCGKEIYRSPSRIRKENFCDQKCRSAKHSYTGPCVICGVPVKRFKSQTMGKALCCGVKCQREWSSRNMRELALKFNPTRMTEEVRFKLRQANVGKGEGKAYPKFLGRHLHRVVAEQVIGRELIPGEIVHHKDENIMNFHKDNLEVLESQSVHIKKHLDKNGGRLKI